MAMVCGIPVRGWKSELWWWKFQDEVRQVKGLIGVVRLGRQVGLVWVLKVIGLRDWTRARSKLEPLIWKI